MILNVPRGRNLSSGVFELQMRRPAACVSAQSDQRLYYSLFRKNICKLDTGDISIFQLISVAEDTGLNLALSETPCDEPQIKYGPMGMGCTLIYFPHKLGPMIYTERNFQTATPYFLIYLYIYATYIAKIYTQYGKIN